MVFCNQTKLIKRFYVEPVTILILIDGFLQFEESDHIKGVFMSHNPYFNRWFSAIKMIIMLKQKEEGHNPYFNRWFSAINFFLGEKKMYDSHNPYFNRWFSAITP